MRITSLASGSSGNSFIIQANGSSVLVDAGLSAKRMLERIALADGDTSSLKGILVSHGHSDHVKGVGALSRKLKIPVYINAGTWREAEKTIGRVHSLELFETGRIFRVSGLRIHPFSVPHDCADPVGFRITAGETAVGIATDLGSATGLVTNTLSGVQALILESNHDPKMLMEGPYPWELKQRVRGRLGHLSNADSAKLLERVISKQLRVIVLAHLSETNNLPELALNCARESISSFLEAGGKLYCASQHEVGPSIDL